MISHFRFYICMLSAALLAACATVHTDLPDASAVTRPAKQTLQTKKQALKAKQKAPAFPQSLGGLVKSDTWTIYKDKEQEELTGNVSYDNGVYAFAADYVLSDRKQHTVTAQTRVYIKYKDEQNTVYEAYADWGRYHYQTGRGKLRGTAKNPVRFILTDTAQTVTATARQADFDTQLQTLTLTGNVFATRVTPQGTQTLRADKAVFKQKEEYLHLQGNASLSDGARTLQADTIFYNGAQNQARAFGARPLVTGTAEQGTFAIIADEVSSDAAGNVVVLDGQVQGWLVAPEINNNKLNTKF